MPTATIVKQTKDYLLIKVPLPRGKNSGFPVQETTKMTKAGERLWKSIQEGEREYREGKTIQASSIDEAIKIYERRRKNKKR